jgi:hypothetical protein
MVSGFLENGQPGRNILEKGGKCSLDPGCSQTVLKIA